MKNKVSCTEVERWIHADIDGRLGSDLEQALKTHLIECERCRHEAQWQKSLRGSFTGVSTSSARARLSRGFSSRFYARLEDQQQKKVPFFAQWGVWKPVLAGGLVFGSAVYFLLPGLMENQLTSPPAGRTALGNTGGDGSFSSVVQGTVVDAERLRADEETRRMLAQNL